MNPSDASVPRHPAAEESLDRTLARRFDPLFSRKNDVVETPDVFFDNYDAEFNFGCDLAALKTNRKVASYFGPDHEDPARRDSLAAEWPTNAPNWLNPPYSQAGKFVQKAAEERRRGATTVMLVPSRTDTAWFHDWIWDQGLEGCRPGIEIRFVRRRITFVGHTAAAPFPSMLVIFRGVPR